MNIYDKIRSMSMQELIELIIEVREKTWYCSTCPHKYKEPLCFYTVCPDLPKEGLVQKWLEQEVPTNETH